MTPAVAPYWMAIEALVEGRLRPDEFETIYLRLFKHDPTKWSRDLYEILNELFFYVDAYWGGDPVLVDADTIDGDQLRERAAEALARLREVKGES